MKRGLMINNIGTPASAAVHDVKTYLDEFLMDPDVIPLPYPLRFILVRGLITPRRSHSSAEKYAKVWTDRGSPLMFYTQDFTQSLQNMLGDQWVVRVGMRYGRPSITETLEEFRAAGVEEVILAPMFPQFAVATSGSAANYTKSLMQKMNWQVPFKALKAFHQDSRYLQAKSELIRPHLQGADHILFSFHGLPESQVRKGEGCLKSENCCARPQACAMGCYRAQSLKTAEDLAKQLGLEKHQWTACFQSRLGPAKWIGPSTDETLMKLAAQGVKKIAVACPAFVTDCLETLEEIGLGAKEDFLKAGGTSFQLAPCLNAHPTWVSTFAELVQDPRLL